MLCMCSAAGCALNAAGVLMSSLRGRVIYARSHIRQWSARITQVATACGCQFDFQTPNPVVGAQLWLWNRYATAVLHWIQCHVSMFQVETSIEMVQDTKKSVSGFWSHCSLQKDSGNSTLLHQGVGNWWGVHGKREAQKIKPQQDLI